MPNLMYAYTHKGQEIPKQMPSFFDSMKATNVPKMKATNVPKG